MDRGRSHPGTWLLGFLAGHQKPQRAYCHLFPGRSDHRRRGHASDDADLHLPGTLLIQEKLPQLIDFRQAVSEAIGTEKHDYFATQAEILKSPSLAAQVIQEQRLDNNKIFTGEEKTGIAAKPWSILKKWVVPRLR